MTACTFFSPSVVAHGKSQDTGRTITCKHTNVLSISSVLFQLVKCNEERFFFPANAQSTASVDVTLHSGSLSQEFSA